MTADTSTLPCMDVSGLYDRFGPIIRLSPQDRRGLTWLKVRARQWLNGLKRRRRYSLPRGCAFTSEESELIGTLTALENAISSLLLSGPSSLCPISDIPSEHTGQGDAEISHTQSSHKTEASIDQARKS